ncbi:hypothetical protein F4778DRAFT_751265 [Xylariomycetidae sp. FL2044]|nr:hypothetical protein F4778DRAFT_751265 [Xylariomycetidae sp. FL2044]
MPPILSRPSMLPRAGAGLGASAPASTSATTVLTTTALSRLFTSTSIACQRIPPESPKFINVPNPPQDQSVEKFRELKPVRGHLPIPRRIFPHRDAHLKATDTWLASATPEPSTPRGRREPRSDIQAWKQRMAASRRENMRSGVRDLWLRKQRADRIRLTRQKAKFEFNRAAAMAPEREDERLTRSSISAATLRTTVIRDPLRFEHALESRARTSAIEDAKSEARRDAIHELYMNARSFIVSEAELEGEVDRLFAENYWKSMGTSGSGQRTRNIWDLKGDPLTVAEMLNDVQRNTSKSLKSLESEETKTHKMQQRVAEELAGGKMDSPRSRSVD